LIDAVKELGLNVKLTAINHWDVAIATHEANHPDVTHYQASIETVQPHEIVPGRRLNLLVASPPCTHFSVARGGKPKAEQLRMDAWALLRWIDELYVDNILIENVPAFVKWGPLTLEGHADKRYIGQTFQAWLAVLKINYNVEYKILNCADYGDPTSRQRFFLLARRPKHKPIVWPVRTHASRKELAKLARQPNLFISHTDLQPWVPAKEIIDWSLEGNSVFGRSTPLKPNTMRRIFAGLDKFVLKPLREKQKSQPFIVPQFSTQKARDIGEPVSGITTTSRGIGVIETEAFQLNLKGSARRDRDINEPTFTQNGGNHQGVVNSFMFNMAHTNNNDAAMCKHLEETLPTIAGKGMFAFVEAQPFVIGQQSGAVPRETNEPVPTVAGKGAIALCESFVTHEAYAVNMKGKSNAREIDEPTFSQTATSHQYLSEAWIVKYYGNGKNAVDTNEPVPTVTGRDRFALAEASIVGSNGKPKFTPKPGELGLYIPDLGIVIFIRFRMLQPAELAKSMSFPDYYRFFGNREDQVKQIGNAVPRKMAKALILCLLGA
jgi:DNA (cytosine-5)-methyltransferase 1